MDLHSNLMLTPILDITFGQKRCTLDSRKYGSLNLLNVEIINMYYIICQVDCPLGNEHYNYMAQM